MRTLESRIVRCFLVFVSGLLVRTAPSLVAAEKGQEPRIVVRLVTDHASGKLVSDLEELHPVVRTVFEAKGSKTITVGERATLWVRNANVDGKFTFERYYQGKYIDRRAELEIDPMELGVGEHVINPGNHRFRLAENGALSSDDPEIKIENQTVSLRLHKVQILGVDAAKAGPPEYRLVGAEFGVLALGSDTVISPEKLPDPLKLPNMLSHSRPFYPLHVYLPSNTVGQGYVLYPSWQAFHLTREGKVDLAGAGAPRVPGIEADGLRIVVPYRKFSGKLSTKTGLSAGVGAVGLSDEMMFCPTLAEIKFRAGLTKPDESFFLPVDRDLSKNPNKFFLADNTTGDPEAIRLLALEWDRPVFARGGLATVSLRFLETAGKATVRNPVVRVAYSPYRPSSPDERRWIEIGESEPLGQESEAESTRAPARGVSWSKGLLRFPVPDLPYDFYVFRAMILDAGSKDSWSVLQGEFMACVVEKGQTGTASFISNKGRDAFVAGEDIRLQVVLRSESQRPSGEREVVLGERFAKPTGEVWQKTIGRVKFRDTGEKWFAKAFVLPADFTRNLPPGQYELTVAGLPDSVVSLPFRFDLVSDQKRSLYLAIKPSKYTGYMNDLIPSHTVPGKAIDLERAMATLSEMGYNRVDLMTYMTNVHFRPHAERELIAAADERLMAPESVYTPEPRDQILNACVRHQLDFSDVFLSYGDSDLPRYIDPYIEASRRWIRRETASMRHSPAFVGMMLYDEMYDQAAVGLNELHQTLFPKLRDERATRELGKHPAKIRSAMSRYIARPKNQRDPEALKDFLRFGKWERHGWGDYNSRVAAAARELMPHIKLGTYHRTWMIPGSAIGIINGYPPDVFESLDLVSHIHYADNSTGWVHTSMLASALRFGPRRPVFINMPLAQEVRTCNSGEYQRHQAFAMLMQGADGCSFWGLPHSFDNGPNPGTLDGKETTRHLNREVLQPFGEIVSRTDPGYQGVGIVTTLNQYLLSEFKEIGVANQAEELWVACWRLGYPAAFLYEDAFERDVSRFKVIFVPGIRFDGELEPKVMEGLERAIRSGSKVVVEKGSELDLRGVTKLDDLTLQDFFVRNYFATWLDDELNKVFEKSQATTQYLAKKLPEWVEPAAWGPFKVGPNWRTSGDINYLIMANFEDPDYGHTVKQIMAKPVRMPLTVPAHRGNVAYDLLRQKELPLSTAARTPPAVSLELDMTDIQGGFVAFLPEAIGKLNLRVETTADARKARLSGELIGASGKAIRGVFPARIRLLGADGHSEQEFFRVLGADLWFEMNLPAASTARALTIEVRESITGQTARLEVNSPTLRADPIQFVEDNTPFVPYPGEVRRFLASTKHAALIVTDRIPGIGPLAKQLVEGLRAKGITLAIEDEMSAFHYPSGLKDQPDPMNDGFHSWKKGSEVIQPATVVDEPVIIMSCKSGSYLLEGLVANGFITENPIGGPLLRAQPTIQVASRGLHWKYDTLCLIANDTAGMQKVVETLLATLPSNPERRPVTYEKKISVASSGITQIAPATSFMGNNELVLDMKFDKAGNVYVITWGHGDNLYSLDPSGKLRFSRQLPEAAASRLDVFDDRVLVFTSAGSRLYQLTLDGKPISQVRLTMDPGPIGDDEYALSYVDYAYIPERRQVLENVGHMQAFDETGKIVAQWPGEPYADKDVSDRIMHRGLHAFAFSPDRTRLAQLETTMYFTRVSYEDISVYDTHLVIRDLDGKLLGEYKDIANEARGITSILVWDKEAPGPSVLVKGEIWQFDASAKLLYVRAYDPGILPLGGLKRLARDGNSLRYLDAEKPEVCRLGPFETIPSTAALSPDGKVLALLDEYGALFIHDAESGKQLARVKVPQLAHTLRFTPDSRALLLGGLRGLVVCYDLEGTVRWQTSLSPFNRTLANPLLYDPSIKDLTEALWPTQRDEPGELDRMVRMGEDRIVNGNCEAQTGWQGEKVAYQTEGFKSPRSLRIGSSTTFQDVTRYLGNHVTWVLEFFYKAVPGAVGATGVPELVAGVQVESKYPYATARRFKAGPDWQFARVAVKSGMQCERLRVGFRANGGDVLVDSVTFRQIRFPSINHMHYEPFYEIEPIVLTNPLFSERYDLVGNARQEAPNQVTIPPYGSGGKPLLEPAFLQNGRINDVGSMWYEMPPVAPWLGGGAFTISLGLKEPRWVSIVALYFNYYDEANVTPHFDIVVTDVESRKEIVVASVRSNKQVFRIVKFPPVKASLVKVVLVNSIKRLRTLTEVELYGPLSGKDVTAGFSDLEGQNTYMGNFARVDKRVKQLAPAYQPPWMRTVPEPGAQYPWSAPFGQVILAEDKMYLTRFYGHNEMSTLAKPLEIVSMSRSRSLGFSQYVTLYGGLLLKAGNDGRLYCIDAQTSRDLWAVKLGERLYAGPVCVQEDVFAASETGKLYKIDLGNGSIMMEVPLSGGVRGCLASDGSRLFFITEDGFVQCFDLAGRKLWATPVAPYTDSTPAVDDGIVYLADQKGQAMALNAANGSTTWSVNLGQEFARCPVVTDRIVLFGCRGGRLTALNRANGQTLWVIQTKSRFQYEPVVLSDQVLYFDDKAALLANIANGSVKEFMVAYPRGNEVELKPWVLPDDPMAPISYYKGSLFVIPRYWDSGHSGLLINNPWHMGNNGIIVVSPKTEPPPQKDKK